MTSDEYKNLKKWLVKLKHLIVKSSKFYKSSSGMNYYSVSGEIKNDAK
jgi:hypothetical protein